MNHERTASIDLPDRRQSSHARLEAQQRFQRALRGWTLDLLLLRKSGELRHAWHEGAPDQGWWNKAA